MGLDSHRLISNKLWDSNTALCNHQFNEVGLGCASVEGLKVLQTPCKHWTCYVHTGKFRVPGARDVYSFVGLSIDVFSTKTTAAVTTTAATIATTTTTRDTQITAKMS